MMALLDSVIMAGPPKPAPPKPVAQPPPARKTAVSNKNFVPHAPNIAKAKKPSARPPPPPKKAPPPPKKDPNLVSIAVLNKKLNDNMDPTD